MFKDVNDYVNFYYNVGAHMADYYGNLAVDDRIKLVNQFRNFVDRMGGVDSFISSEQAFYKFVGEHKGVKYVKKFRH